MNVKFSMLKQGQDHQNPESTAALQEGIPVYLSFALLLEDFVGSMCIAFGSYNIFTRVVLL